MHIDNKMYMCQCFPVLLSCNSFPFLYLVFTEMYRIVVFEGPYLVEQMIELKMNNICK